MWVGLSAVFAFMHFFLCYHTICHKLMQLGSPNLTWTCCTVSPGNPFILRSEGERWKVNITRHSKSVSVFRWNAILMLALHVSHAGFSPLQCPTAGVPCVEFFAVKPVAKTLPCVSWRSCECWLLLIEGCLGKLRTVTRTRIILTVLDVRTHMLKVVYQLSQIWMW